MKTATAFPLALAFALGALAPSPAARAQLRVTEAMSSSGATVDWFELTNFGPVPLTLAGSKVDDSSNSAALAVALNGVTTLNPGESAVFLESAGGADIPGFRTFWGGSALSAQIGFYSGSGVGLSSGGDGVVVFDALNNVQAPLFSFGAATANVSFDYNRAAPASGILSVAGQNGAFNSAGSPVNIGSPGVVPEPSAYALFALGGLALLGCARRPRTA